jgi:O-antigen ligase
MRSPVIGSGLGSYRHVIGLDKPSTGTSFLEQAHNDWLEWASTTGVAGIIVLTLLLLGLWAALRPRRARRLRFDLRYPLAGAAVALTATALHEMVGFGLQTPINKYLLAVWIGLVWGVWRRVEEGRGRSRDRGDTEQPVDDDAGPADIFGDRDGDGDGHGDENNG